ncbi:hypothetical protein WA026_013349 [Henosepilachna vigintioctopunctata]|uniref:Tetratricopeptide repeat protein 37 n=1 Tax=Henosepilachna vigintioctopunctata TaxID=420089 RepID=A0AAW1VER5_9CUCU
MGITYLEIGQLDECLYHFLLAAKKDQKNFYCFYYLGRCYGEMKNYDKARRCYETSIKLYPSYSEAAMELSKIYRILKQWDSNTNLLKTITKDRITKQNVWAWLQLGLNLLEQGDNDLAAEYLKKVSRIDSENAHCWEALADAYLSRGGYVSAQKAYERVLEISDDALYPSLQIATIKKDLGHLQESIHDFESLLMRTKNCMLTLTGLAETCLKQAKEYFLEQRLGAARDYAQYAVEAVTGAIKQYSELSCLWKILGDCCMVVTKLPDRYCCLMIMKAVDEGIDIEGNKILERDSLFQLAAKCYCKASVLIETKEYIWHDLAACYLCQAKQCEDKDVIDDLLEKARAIIQQCTTVNPGCWQHWNLLGNIAMTFDPPNYALAQHAFIKSVSLDHNCAVAWCNLGVIYLINNNLKLANKAFAEAQRSDPDYIQSWIGQGLLAEITDNESEAMDLFRHSTSLGFHPQGAVGYGDLVCRKVTASPLNLTSYDIEKLHAIPVACDALTWLTGRCCAS